MLIKNIFSENNICLLSRADIGIAVTDINNFLILFPTEHTNVCFTCAAFTAVGIMIREIDRDSFTVIKIHSIGKDGDARQLILRKNMSNVEFQAIRYNFEIEALSGQVVIEIRESFIQPGEVWQVI